LSHFLHIDEIHATLEVCGFLQCHELPLIWNREKYIAENPKFIC